jgi:glutathione S-transferase
MPDAKITLHQTPISNPCMAVRAALDLKGLDYEVVDFPISPERAERMEEIYGAGRRTVPGMLVGEERVHSSLAIMARLEELAPVPPLYPADIAAEVREAARWGDEFQDMARRLPFGALHFRPEFAGIFAGVPQLDPAGVDAAIKGIRSTWKWQGITAVRLSDDLAALPGHLDHIDALAADGIVGAESPTAADLQIGSTVRILLIVGDLAPLFEGRSAAEIAMRWFPEYPGEIPAGAFPAGWVPPSRRGP